MIFVLIMVLASSSLLLKSLNLNYSNNKASINHEVLSQAKEALLGYAISYADRNPTRLPGYLPCPDFNGDGISDIPCGLDGESSLGRLPWQTLGLKPLRDSAGECLWYAISGAYKESLTNTLSIDSNGQFLLFDSSLNSLNGNNLSETALAVVFSPGTAINNQRRSVTIANATECGSNIAADEINRSSSYLDNFNPINNANGSHTANNILGMATNIIPSPTPELSTFIHSGLFSIQSPSIFNDTFMKISPVDFQAIYRYMQQWIGEKVRQCLFTYATNNTNKLPWPAILQTTGDPTYTDNNTHLRFGRIANSLLNSIADDAGLNPLWPIDPNQLGIRCFDWEWWPNVRESVFVAIDNSIAPIVNPVPTTLSVDANAEPAAIFIAGRANFFNQNRVTGDDKGTLSNYMESNNIIDLGTGAIPPGNEDFISNDLAAFFNDYVCTLNSCP